LPDLLTTEGRLFRLRASVMKSPRLSSLSTARIWRQTPARPSRNLTPRIIPQCDKASPAHPSAGRTLRSRAGRVGPEPVAWRCPLLSPRLPTRTYPSHCDPVTIRNRLDCFLDSALGV